MNQWLVGKWVWFIREGKCIAIMIIKRVWKIHVLFVFWVYCFCVSLMKLNTLLGHRLLEIVDPTKLFLELSDQSMLWERCLSWICPFFSDLEHELLLSIPRWPLQHLQQALWFGCVYHTSSVYVWVWSSVMFTFAKPTDAGQTTSCRLKFPSTVTVKLLCPSIIPVRCFKNILTGVIKDLFDIIRAVKNYKS